MNWVAAADMRWAPAQTHDSLAAADMRWVPAQTQHSLVAADMSWEPAQMNWVPRKPAAALPYLVAPPAVEVAEQ